jgi:predicted RNA binding protein YcfA (HicA-like mRNA interferase family)
LTSGCCNGRRYNSRSLAPCSEDEDDSVTTLGNGMTKPSKLYDHLLANPGAIISFRDFERLIDAFGWQHKRTKGSHRSYAYPSVPAVLTINPDGKSAHRYQVRLLLEFIEAYGLHIDA